MTRINEKVTCLDLVNNPALTVALAQAVGCAKRKYDGELACIQRGVDMILAGQVELHGDTAHVHSRSSNTIYVMRSLCTCRGAKKAPEGRCSHWYAANLLRKAQRIVGGLLPPVKWVCDYYRTKREVIRGEAWDYGVIGDDGFTRFWFVPGDGSAPAWIHDVQAVLGDIADLQEQCDRRTAAAMA
jgi:hypothetical protein